MLKIEELTSSGGRSYVRQEIAKWPEQAVKQIVASLKRLSEHGLDAALKIRLVEKMVGYSNLYEIRERDNSINYRIFFPCIDNTCWLVLAVRKKGRKLPLHEIRLADERARSLNH